MRRDLKVVAVSYHGEDAFVAKDPLALRYYRLRPDEHFVLTALDGSRSLTALRDAYHQAFATRRITLPQLNALLMRFHQFGLVTADAAGQGPALRDRRRRETRKRLWGTLSNVLAMRLPGVDPDRGLNFFYPVVRPFFSPLFLCLAGFLCAGVLLHFLANFQSFMRELPSADLFLRAENLWLTMLVLSGTKILHELGHAFACKHFGGDCHQLGVMFLVFTPALYCDTSDSWLIPSRWQRAAVGAAGMLVEIFLAAIASIIWWNAEPGWTKTIAIQIMTVCTVSTLLFNANPLLRFDGYFILADLVNLPNLGQRSHAVLAGFFRRWWLGQPVSVEPMLSGTTRGWMMIYAVASMVYRWLMVGVILLYVLWMFEPVGIRSLGLALVVVAIVAMTLPLMISWGNALRRPVRRRGIRRGRWLLTFACLIGIIACALVPIPHAMETAAVVRPADLVSVFVTIPGTLASCSTAPSQIVNAGEPLVQLINPNVELERVQALGKRDAQRLLVAALKQSQRSHPEVSDQIPSAEAVLTELEARLEKKTRQQAQLQITAPIRGRIVSPMGIVSPVSTSEESDSLELPYWSGLPLDRENLGTFLETGTELCKLAPNEQWSIELYIPQRNREQLALEQEVEVMLDAHPGKRWRGTLKQIAERKAETIPFELSADGGGPIASEQVGSNFIPLKSYFQAKVELVTEEPALINGMRGVAKIHTKKESLWSRCRRGVAWRLKFNVAD
jgi:putative peptide zinc metalloprotease protein